MVTKEEKINDKELRALSDLFNTSYSYPADLNGMEKWAAKLCLEQSYDKYFEEDCESEEEALNTFDFHEFCDSPQNIILYLAYKGFLDRKQLKQLIGNNSYGSCCYGEWREEKILKDLNLSFVK